MDVNLHSYLTCIVETRYSVIATQTTQVAALGSPEFTVNGVCGRQRTSLRLKDLNLCWRQAIVLLQVKHALQPGHEVQSHPGSIFCHRPAQGKLSCLTFLSPGTSGAFLSCQGPDSIPGGQCTSSAPKLPM